MTDDPGGQLDEHVDEGMDEGMDEGPAPEAAAPWHSQDQHLVRLEWGPTGAAALARWARASGHDVVAVVADVLSFTTCVSVAADLGTRVRPHRWTDASAHAVAQAHGAVLAGARGEPGAVTLSPASLREVGVVGEVVLPSPNGSIISAVLADCGAQVVAACLRNRAAVGRRLAARLEAEPGRPPVVVLVPAGERWPDGSLRPAPEDLWGVGAVVEVLLGRLGHRAGPLLLSPEARVALAAWQAVSDDVAGALRACSSGRELVERGWPGDVDVAAELDASDRVPTLVDGVFVDASGR